ncbi:MAG: bifunctional enoyl-CoA hydratase/phosphate acetyltransferase [Burkholderiales bacterium]|nr:bifunctional enoyl-CoA hydratase/phosphate acetyltransferase [Burkholderiales bacterium]
MATRAHFQVLVEKARRESPLSAAIVFPCDVESLQLALAGAFAGYLDPTLVGPEARIRDLADRSGLDISRLPVVDTADDPRAAGVRAAELARSGRIAGLVRGKLTNEELLAPVVATDSGLRTERRLSHAFFLDWPGQPRGLLLADAHMNVAPNLAAKRDIVQNTIQLARALGITTPNVALLAAMDGPAPSFRSTTDAVALKAMANQHMFGDAVVDGPLAPDSALSAECAVAKEIESDVAGRADVLIAPSMESALMVLRTMQAFASGLAAGVVLGARIPIVAPARHDSMEVRMASCVLATLLTAAGAGAATARVSADTGARAAA